MNVVVREAAAGSSEDATAICRLIGSLAMTMGEESPITPQYAGLYLATPGNVVLLAREADDGRPIGLISCSIRPNLYHAGESALIEELIVAEGARNRGIGGELLRQLLARLEARGCAEVSVTTMPDNQGAIRFYRSHGLTNEAVFLERHFAE